ncbi:MAG: rRNA pseudouridine synthase, partial [Gemmatimonadetes bacterium]|nr:rRNA pseudouridine synthase [Gemmatimonadota bacterium]
MPDESVRIQKYLSQAGRASRREAERLMEAGRVTVNGEVVTELGSRVVPDRDEVAVDGESVRVAAERWIMLHKPSGVLTTRSDPHGGRTVYDLLPEALHGLTYVGRLDLDAEGLLLFTNDGDTAHGIQHPSREVEREYWLEVAGTFSKSAGRALTSGVELDDGVAEAKRVFGVDPGPVTSTLSLVITEGRKREVRRMLSEVGHAVMRL